MSAVRPLAIATNSVPNIKRVFGDHAPSVPFDAFEFARTVLIARSTPPHPNPRRIPWVIANTSRRP